MRKGFRPAKACPREGGGEGDHRGAVRPQLFGVLDQRDEPGAGCEFGAICRSPVGRSLPYLILDARYERVREAGVITSQAVLIAIGIDWDGRRQSLPQRKPGCWRSSSPTARAGRAGAISCSG